VRARLARLSIGGLQLSGADKLQIGRSSSITLSKSRQCGFALVDLVKRKWSFNQPKLAYSPRDAELTASTWGEP